MAQPIKLGHHGSPETLSGAPQLETEANKTLHSPFDAQANFAGLLMDTAMANPKGFAEMIKQMHADHASNPSVPDAQLDFQHGQLSGIDFSSNDGKSFHLGIQLPDEQNSQINQVLAPTDR